MMSINLIPAHRLRARRVQMRIHFWVGAVSVCLFTLITAHVWVIATWHDDSDALQVEIEKADAEIRDLERAGAASRAALAEAQATLRARRAVGDQPDWGLLLATLAARLDQQAVLSACILEPATTLAAGSPTRSSGSESQRRLIRPSQYTLTLAGLARTQDAASSIAIALERTTLFDHVTLLEARRSGFRGEEAVTFRLECALADPAAEVQ